MDPFSVTLGTLQIAGQCVQIGVALARYINQVKTVDQRIQAFYEDVAKLQNTYETLQQCRSSPQMLAAAKAADELTENLWSHLGTTLRDCENTLVAINLCLAKINRPLGLSAHLRQFVESPIKQLQEQLYGGELGRYQEKVKMFNTSLALPMQMINITLQLSQRELSEEHQRRLEDRLVSMQRTIDSLHANINDLKHPKSMKRSSTMGSATLVGGQTTDRAVCDHMETFAIRAKQFLSNASSAAVSTRSGGSTIYPDNALAIRGASEVGVPLTHRQKEQIGAWVPPWQEDANTSPNASEATPPPTEYDGDGVDEEDFDLDLARTYFDNGQTDLVQDDFAAAEENFAEALAVLQNNDFGERLAFQSADVILMLTHCYVEQGKCDQAIELLLPLTEGDSDGNASGPSSGNLLGPPFPRPAKRPDHGRILAAHHSLGNVYLKKQEYDNAERHVLCAFKGRRKFFGKDHEKTIESVQLVVDVYIAKGERAKARAYSKHLAPDTNSDIGVTDHRRRLSANTSSGSGQRPLVLRSIQSTGRTQTAPTLTVPSPPLVNSTFTRHSPGEFNRTESFSHTVHSAVLPSVFDDTSTVSSITRSSIQRSASVTPRHYLKPRFDAVTAAAKVSKDKACDATQHILRGYDPEPSKILIHRWDDIKKNIRKQGAEKGLAATGSGYAPIHFFSELKEEASTEVELLIEDGADLMAVRYRAGYGKQEPMTPLQLALEKNHQTIAIMMIDALQASGTPMTMIMALKDRDGLSPLLVACRNGQVYAVTRFLEYGAGVASGFPRLWCGNSLLHDACFRCDVDMVNLLLSIRIEGNALRHDIGALNQQDQFGRTPLMYAVISKSIPDQSQLERKLRGRYHCVEMLLKNAVEGSPQYLNVQDNQNMNLWSHAKEERDGQLLELLRRYGLGDENKEMSP